MGICFSSDSPRSATKPVTKQRPVAEWSPADVQDYLHKLHLGGLVEAFAENGISGKDLLSLSEEDMIEHLGCTPLQVRKIKSNLPRRGGSQQQLQPLAPAYAPPPISPAAQQPYPAVPIMSPPAPVYHAPVHPVHPVAVPVAFPPPAAVPGVVPVAAPAPVPAATQAPAPPVVPVVVPVVEPAPAPAAVPQAGIASGDGAKAAAPVGADQATELERAALDLRTRAAEAQRHAGTYGQASALLHQAEGKLHGAIKSLSVTGISSAMGMGRTIGVAARGVRGPARRTMMRGGLGQNMIEIATVRRADAAVQSAAADISQARALIPTIPYIQEAMLQGARQGVFVNLLLPGVATSALQMSRVRRGLDSVEKMYGQVQQSRDWVVRNQQAFQGQANQLNSQAEAKQAQAHALRAA